MELSEKHYFRLLKKDIQQEYLTSHTPVEEDISKWKGIDIIYFQEDLRKKAKGNISEKTFYTYFKSNSSPEKLPRIDMLNILSIYVGYKSWSDYKKQKEPSIKSEENAILQKTNSENQSIEYNKTVVLQEQKTLFNTKFWILLSLILGIIVIFFVSKSFINQSYKFCFIDADRGTPIQNTIDIKVFKENESPIHYKVKPGECFTVSTNDKTLHMEVNSAMYEKTEIFRNLENAPETEQITLKPDDYALMLYYYSTKDTDNSSLENIKSRQQKLNHLISEKALIYQVFDNETYGVETLTKQKYIGLVTTPTQSLQNLKVLSTRMENGKIISIKFKIEKYDQK